MTTNIAPTRTARTCPSGGDATARRVVVRIPLAPLPALAPNRLGHEHWRSRQRAAKELRTAARYAEVTWHNQGPRYRLDVSVHIHEHIIWPKGKRLKDPDSLAVYAKPALDGIVDAGLIAGDSHKHIASVTTSQEKGTDPLGWTIITIEEAA